MTEERAFVEQWWQRKFSITTVATDKDVIMFAHALELLTAYQEAGAAKPMTEPTAKHWLEGWWLRKFEADPPKHGSVLNLANAETLLIEFRRSTTDSQWCKNGERD